MIFGVGLFMGFLTHTTRNKAVKLPHKLQNSWNPGFLLDSLWGGVGSVLLVLVAGPSDNVRTLILSIIGGYMGQSVIHTITDKWIKDKEKEIEDLINSDIDLKK